MSLRYQKFVPEDAQQKPKIYPLSIIVDEAMSAELEKEQRSFLKCTVCCGVVSAVILIVAVVMLVLGFTVLHIKNPKLRLNSVSIPGLDRVNSTELRNGNANLTLLADVSVKNTNVEAFKFENFTSSLLYRDTVVGMADVPGGVVKAGKTARLNLEYEMVTAKMAGGELTAGNFTVQSYTRVNGRVNILNVIKRKLTVTMNCSIAVNVMNGIVGQDCKNHAYI